jgi:transketolase
MTRQSVVRLQEIARELRRDIVSMIHIAGDGHPGPALSVVDLIAALYFQTLRIDPLNPEWQERDRFLLSKGHACPALYAALAKRGFFSRDLLPTFRSLGSILQGHPEMKAIPGVDMTSGSLGHGISIGAGMAAAGRVLGKNYRVYVIVGDGELNEGLCWEGIQVAAHLHLDRLIVFVDHNGFQSGGSLREVSGLDLICAKFSAFGWSSAEIDGHDFRQILEAVERARRERGRPSVIVAKTVKGKGIPFMEGDNRWHKRTPTAAELQESLKALGGFNEKTGNRQHKRSICR